MKIVSPFIFRRKPLNVNEALGLLEDLDKGEDLFIVPPELSSLTDDDSGSEGDRTVFSPGCLSRNQLLAPAQF